MWTIRGVVTHRANRAGKAKAISRWLSIVTKLPCVTLIGLSMSATFDSWLSYRIFADEVRSKTRYIYNQPTRSFLEAIVAASKSRSTQIKQGSRLWRAQLGSSVANVHSDEYTEDVPFESERMKPTAEFSQEGRANPRGIPYLYLATTMETALAEQRPWLGAKISVAVFKTTKDVVLVNCVDKNRGDWYYEEEPPPKERESSVWRDLSRAFSTPVAPNDPLLDYAPTQVVAEVFRYHGYDGILYKSLLGHALNVVLFDVTSASIEFMCLQKTPSLEFKFDELFPIFRIK